MAEMQYVTRLVKVECSMGSMKNPLNVTKDHGVVWEQESVMLPIMNANDHTSGENVIHFGRCKSDKNPGNSFSLESMVMSVLIPGSSLLKSLMGCDGCKCEPMTLTPWVNTSTKHMVEGAPGIISESKLTCYYGGIISIYYEQEAVESK